MFDSEEWFEKYLPPGVKKDDLSKEDIRTLVHIFSDAEVEAEEYFEKIIVEAFYETLKGSIADEINKLLPKTPVVVQWKELSSKKREELKHIYLESMKRGITEKTIRKHLRKPLLDVIEKKKKKSKSRKKS